MYSEVGATLLPLALRPSTWRTDSCIPRWCSSLTRVRRPAWVYAAFVALAFQERVGVSLDISLNLLRHSNVRMMAALNRVVKAGSNAHFPNGARVACGDVAKAIRKYVNHKFDPSGSASPMNSSNAPCRRSR